MTPLLTLPLPFVAFADLINDQFQKTFLRRGVVHRLSNLGRLPDEKAITKVPGNRIMADGKSFEIGCEPHPS